MFGASQNQLIRRPSIQLAADESFSIEKAPKQDRILAYFVKPDLKTFDLQIFSGYSNPNFEFKLMLNALKSWNNSLEQNKAIYHSKTQQARHQFIYSTLKRIMQKGQQSSKQELNSLMNWFYGGKKKYEQPINKKKKFASDSNSEWKIKQNFSYDTVSELKNYRRKQLGSFDKMNFFTTAYHSPQKEESKTIHRKSRTDSDFNRFYLDKQFLFRQQKQLRMRRQKSEIQNKQKVWAIKKARIAEQTLQNFYEGKFQKPTELFYYRVQRKTDNPLSRVKYYQLNSTFSQLQTSFNNKSLQKSKQSALIDTKNKENTPNINGISLIKNPFQNLSKLKKKKR